MSNYGPTRGELWFRLVFSIAGLALMIFAVAYRGFNGIASVEIIGIAGAFFGGTLIWSVVKLLRTR